MSVRPSLPYHGIARRAVKAGHVNDPPPYDTDIDVDAFISTPMGIKRVFNVIDRKEEKENKLTSNEYNYDGAWIQTYSKKKFFPLNPQPDQICIEDIAHALSNCCRFTGHTNSFYSISQHCVLVSYLCKPHERHGVLHDASEAYICDIASPLKRTPDMRFYKAIEKKIQDAIYLKFELDIDEPAEVKQADLLLLNTEARDLMGPLHEDWKSDIKPLPFHIEPWEPKKAKEMFLNRFYELFPNYK